MKKVMKISLIIISIFVLIMIIISSMFLFKLCPPEGPWPTPPWCASPEIGAGVATTASFFVSIPYNTPGEDIYFVTEGKEPIKMKKVGELSYQISRDVVGQETLKYKYATNSGASDNFQTIITKKYFKKYDGVSGWDDLNFKPNFSQDFTFGTMMFDTWGKNYNFNMFENTRDNIDSSFTRLAKLNMKSVAVTDMFRAVYANGEGKNYDSLNYTIEDAIFSDDFRDEALTQEDMNHLAKSAHENGMKLIIETGISLINYGNYIGSDNIRADWDKDLARQAQPKTKEWVEDFFNKKEKKLLEVAKMLDKAGADEIIINQRNEIPTKPFDEYTNQRLKELTQKIHQSTSLKVGVFVKEGEAFSPEWNSKYDFYKDADDVYLIVESIDPRYSPKKGMSFEETKNEFGALLDDYAAWAQKNNVKVKMYLGTSSFKDSLMSGYIEFNDVKNPLVKNMIPDWQYQADSYEAFLQSVQGREFVEGVIFMGYWWDDAMDPETANTRISISFSNRNKDAEAVMMKWGNSI